MRALIVRHAVALKRGEWHRPDHLRPLTERGYEQAAALVDGLAPYDVVRVLSSPFVRCVETVEPLSAKLGLAVEEVEELAEGQGSDALTLLDGAQGDVVLCTHGDVAPELVLAVAPDARRRHGNLPCAKGSIWVIDMEGGGRSRAIYLPPLA